MKVLKVEELVKEYPLKGGALNRVKGSIRAVNGVSFEVEEGTTFGIAGESGSGKSTLCMTIAKLLEPTSGKIILDEKDYGKAKGEELQEFRTKLQIVFQNPLSSLDPHMNVRTIVLEPMKALGRLDKGSDREAIVNDLLDKVGLSPSIADRFPHELSGGQAQRVSIARALSVNPRVLLLDEPTSALDASVQAQVLNVFNELQKSLGVAYIIVSHDLSVIAHMCDEVAIMYAGRFVEAGRYDDMFYSPQHPYTAALLASAGMVESHAANQYELKHDMPNPKNLPPGCTLNPRCPFVSDRCRAEYPSVVDVGSGHVVACHNREALIATKPGVAQ